MGERLSESSNHEPSTRQGRSATGVDLNGHFKPDATEKELREHLFPRTVYGPSRHRPKSSGSSRNYGRGLR